MWVSTTRLAPARRACSPASAGVRWPARRPRAPGAAGSPRRSAGRCRGRSRPARRGPAVGAVGEPPVAVGRADRPRRSSVKCGTSWKRQPQRPDLDRRAGLVLLERRTRCSIRSSLPQAPTTRRKVAAAPGGAISRGRAGSSVPGMRRTGHGLLARRVGQRVASTGPGRGSGRRAGGRSRPRRRRCSRDAARSFAKTPLPQSSSSRRLAVLDQVAAAGAAGVLPGRRLAEHGEPHRISLLAAGHSAPPGRPAWRLAGEYATWSARSPARRTLRRRG